MFKNKNCQKNYRKCRKPTCTAVFKGSCAHFEQSFEQKSREKTIILFVYFTTCHFCQVVFFLFSKNKNTYRKILFNCSSFHKIFVPLVKIYFRCNLYIFTNFYKYINSKIF